MSRRGFPITKAHRAERRARAEKMLAEYNKLTTQQKLDRLPTEGCRKQRKRLVAKLESEKLRVASGSKTSTSTTSKQESK